MLKILNRDEFISHFRKLLLEEKGPIDIDHPLFIPERAFRITCNWFVESLPIVSPNGDYFDWCSQSLKGRVLCFSSGETEWWGFTDYDDIVVWSLRWC